MPNLSFRELLHDNFHFIKSEFVVLTAALISPVISMLFLIGGLIFVDTVSGIVAAVKINGWSGFKSRLLSNGLLPKLILYPLAILISQAVENEFSYIPIMKVTGFLIMSFEFKSIGENYKKIFGVSILGEIKQFLNRK